MKNTRLSTTAGSSLPYVAEIEGLSPGAQAYLYAEYAEHQRLKALPAQQTQAMRQVKINAATVKDQALQAAVAMVLIVKPLAKKGWRNRASFIQEQLELTPTAWGLPADYNPRERDIRLIREVLHEWENLNGLTRKSVPLE